MLFSILFMLAFLAQRTLGACNVCGQPGFAPTLNTKIYVGAQYWYCSEFVSRSNEFDANTCAVVQSYALANCGCQNAYRSPPPPPPLNLGTMCNVCGGSNGSNLHSPPASMWNYNVGAVGLGITATCGFFFETAMQGAFGAPDSSSCHSLQESTRAICSCGGPGW
jgi:hypothetical protein